MNLKAIALLTNEELVARTEETTTPSQGLALAVDMLRAIAREESWKSHNYFAAVHRLEALLALEKLEHAQDALVQIYDQWSPDYEEASHIIGDAVSRVRGWYNLAADPPEPSCSGCHERVSCCQCDGGWNEARRAEDAGRTAIGNTPTCEDCGAPQDHCVCPDDVCIVGNPARHGICGDPLCLCANEVAE